MSDRAAHTAPSRALTTASGVLLLVAGLIDLAAGQHRLSEDKLSAMLLLTAGVGQLLLTFGLVVRPTRWLMVGAAVVGAGVAAVWAASRAIGLPMGPALWQPLVIGLDGLICAGLQTGAALLLAAALRRGPGQQAGRGRWRAITATALSGVVTVPLLILALAGQVDDLVWPDRPTVVPGGAATFTYCTSARTALAMDLIMPANGVATPVPVALFVHGGGWAMEGRTTELETPLVQATIHELGARGIAVAAIDYRLTPVYPWPAQIEDTKCAVRFLRAHATELGLDAQRITAFGGSAGGQLVTLLATAGPDAGWDGGQYAEQSSGVQAAVDMFGPADLMHFDDSVFWARGLIQLLVGNSAEVRRAASPITYAHADAAPLLILQGTDDVAVPPRQSRELAESLKRAGAQVELVMVQGGTHGLVDPGEEPSVADLARVTAGFLASLGQSAAKA